jgi:hypothetical protein
VSTPRPEVVSELVATARAAEQQEAEAPTRFYQNPGDSQVSGVAVPEGASRSVVSNSVVTAPEYPQGEPISTASRGNATIITQTPRSVNIALLALGGVALLFAGVATAALVVLAKDRSAPPQVVAAPPSLTVAPVGPPRAPAAPAPAPPPPPPPPPPQSPRPPPRQPPRGLPGDALGVLGASLGRAPPDHRAPFAPEDRQDHDHDRAAQAASQGRLRHPLHHRSRRDRAVCALV